MLRPAPRLARPPISLRPLTPSGVSGQPKQAVARPVQATEPRVISASPPALLAQRPALSCRSAVVLRVVLAQLVVQRLEADAQNLRGARLVVISMFERAQDELFLGFAHGGADRKADRIAILGGRRVGWRRGGQRAGLQEGGEGLPLQRAFGPQKQITPQK